MDLTNTKSSYVGGTELMLLNLKKIVFPLAPKLKNWNWLISPGRWEAALEDKNPSLWPAQFMSANVSSSDELRPEQLPHTSGICVYSIAVLSARLILKYQLVFI